jgi:hypothetical protein
VVQDVEQPLAVHLGPQCRPGAYAAGPRYDKPGIADVGRRLRIHRLVGVVMAAYRATLFLETRGRSASYGAMPLSAGFRHHPDLLR